MAPSHDGLTTVIQMTDSVLLNATRTNHMGLLAVINQTKRRQMLREAPGIPCPTHVNRGTRGMLGPRGRVGQLQGSTAPLLSSKKTKIPQCHLPCQTFLQGDAAAETATFLSPAIGRSWRLPKGEKNLYNKSSEVNTSTQKRSDPAQRHL